MFLLGSSLVAQMAKNPPAMQETRVQSLSQEDPLEKGLAMYYCLENFMDREASRGLQSMGSKRVVQTEQLILSLFRVCFTSIRS